jgi:hypothetical protein
MRASSPATEETEDLFEMADLSPALTGLDRHGLSLVRRWIELNRDAIIADWDGDLLTDEVVARLQPIAPAPRSGGPAGS